MTYGTDAVATHLSNAYRYLDTGVMQPTDPSAENLTATANRGFIICWNRLSASREVQPFVRLHSDICNVPLYFMPVIRFQVRLTKARPRFYQMNMGVDSKNVFKFLVAQLLVRPVKPKPAILLAHISTLKNFVKRE